MKPLAKAALAMPQSGIRRLMDLAAGRPDVIHLEVGEPDANTPEAIIEAAAAAARQGFTKYSPNAGFSSLRAAIVAKLAHDNGLTVGSDQVVVTPGAVAALAASVLAIIDPGDEVLLPDPGWPNYRSLVVLAGGVPVAYPLRREDGYMPDLDGIAALVTPRTKMILVNSPSNPCGTVFSPALVENLVRFAERHDLYLLSDEVYEAFVFEGEHVSPGVFDRDGRVIGVFGFSKTFAMTGWRLGYAVASREVAGLMAKIQSPLVSCSSSLSQKGAEAALALPASFAAVQRDDYRTRRDLVVRLLGGAGLLAAAPEGAFYALVDLSSISGDSEWLAETLLTEAGVATAPGETFGKEAAGMVRISFAASLAAIEEGCRRILGFVQAAQREAQ
jgi:aspartate aminotransferase/aminotransferase